MTTRTKLGRAAAACLSIAAPFAAQTATAQVQRPKEQSPIGTERWPTPTMRDALAALVMRQIEACYMIPPGAQRSDGPAVIQIHLHPDGSLADEPLVLKNSGAAGRSIAQAALRAVRRCAPYKIPAQYAPYYNDWKSIHANFEVLPD